MATALNFFSSVPSVLLPPPSLYFPFLWFLCIPADWKLCEVRGYLITVFLHSLFSESAAEPAQGLEQATGGVSLSNDCRFASRAGDGFLPLAELTYDQSWEYFLAIHSTGSHLRLWKIWGELATVSLHREEFLSSKLVCE